MNTYLESQLTHVCPVPEELFSEYGFKIKINNPETGANTNWLNVSPEQFKAIEVILLGGE